MFILETRHHHSAETMSTSTDPKPRNWMPSQQEGRAVFDEWWSSDECGPSWSTTGNDGWRIWCRASSWFEDKVIDNMSAALSAQAAETARIRDALKVAEGGLLAIENVAVENFPHASVALAAYKKMASAALAQIREARKP